MIFIISDEYKLGNQGNSKHDYPVALEEGWRWQMMSQDHFRHNLLFGGESSRLLYKLL